MHITGFVVCVGMDDLASLTLHRNIRQLDRLVVVTSRTDQQTRSLCNLIPNVSVWSTDEFYQKGAFFNKGAALNSALRHFRSIYGWFLIHDIDIVFPDNLREQLESQVKSTDFLYGCPRRICDPISRWNEEGPQSRDTWGLHYLENDPRIIGYFQLAHRDARSIAGVENLYDPTFTHGCGSDIYFQDHFPAEVRKHLDLEVLHLGQVGTGWFGRAAPRLDGTTPPDAERLNDLVVRYAKYRGWCGYAPSGEKFPDRIA